LREADLRAGGEMFKDALGSQDSTATRQVRGEQATGMATRVSCKDCYFNKNMLCALARQEPCPTYRPADRGLAPERQLMFVFRTERTRSAYAFPMPR
jgi:hypothetical protein